MMIKMATALAVILAALGFGIVPTHADGTTFNGVRVSILDTFCRDGETVHRFRSHNRIGEDRAILVRGDNTDKFHYTLNPDEERVDRFRLSPGESVIVAHYVDGDLAMVRTIKFAKKCGEKR